ncbi:MAG: glycosyltransferase family 39 protein, partial [Anaerolineaceae bacterium]|nr:glycosyltransferase family 39 protein [Anaerolineaceae bacterium]
MNTSKSNPENHPLFALLLSLTGFVVYLAQSIRFAIRLPSILDEAAYLFKGYLYATGAYQPFEPYGPWANKMPLVFLIPGWFQQLFGPGLRTGRVFAILLGVLMLLGLWLLLRRLANLWWAAAGVWIIALTPAMIRNYSVFWSQGLTATMLIWVLALTLGEDRKPWQTTLGALLAALMALSRQNMMPFIVLLIPFIFWQNGKKAGIWAAVVSVVSFLIFHALYFPEIFRLWAIWLPGSLRNILEDWGLIIQTRASWQPSYTNLDRLRAFWEGVRFHYLLSALILSTLLFFPWFKAAKIHPKKKSILFLLVNLGLLGVMHSMASLTGSYCVYCFTNYLDFFIIIAIPLIALTFSGWQQSGPRWRQVAGLVFSGLMGVLIFLPFLPKISVWLLSRPMPRVKNGKFLEGTAALSQLVEGKFHLNLQTQQIPMANLFTGLTIFSLIALISFLLLRLVNHKRAENR